MVKLAVLMGLLIALSSESPAFEKKTPTDTPYDYDDLVGKMPLIGWVMDTYRSAGYAVPYSGVTFCFSQMYVSVDTVDELQAWDTIMFMQGNEKQVGILSEFDAASDTGLVKILYEGTPMSVSVSGSDILWGMRPHKAPASSAGPSI